MKVFYIVCLILKTVVAIALLIVPIVSMLCKREEKEPTQEYEEVIDNDHQGQRVTIATF